MINLYSNRVHPRRVFPTNNWIDGLSDYNKTGGAYLWAQGVDYRTEPTQLTLLPQGLLEAGNSVFSGLVKWGEQVIGKTTAVGGGSNLISNPSFATGTSGWSLDADYTRSNADAYQGGFSIKQLSTTGFLNLTTNVTVTPNTDYLLTFWTKVSATGLVTLFEVDGVQFQSNTNVLGAQQPMTDTAGQWVQRSYTFNSGPYSSLQLRFFNNNGAVTAFYDTFSLTQISSLSTFSVDSNGGLYKRNSLGKWSFLQSVPNSHGNGLGYYGQDDFLYYPTDKTIGRFGPISSNTPTFSNDWMTALGGVPTNTNSLALIAANSDYANVATPSAALLPSGDIALEAFIKPTSLPAVGNSMTLMGIWKESTNQRAWKLDIYGISGVFGTGADGSLTISTNTTDSPIDSACSGTVNTNQLFATNASFAAGQKILIMQMQGAGAGTFQETTIQAYDSTNHIITTTDLLNFSYNSAGGNAAQVLVGKQYTNVTVNANITWTAKAWNGTTGGILYFFCNGTFLNNGTVSAIGVGFRGGNGGNSSNCEGGTGENYTSTFVDNRNNNDAASNGNPPIGNGGGGGSGNTGGSGGNHGGGAGGGNANQGNQGVTIGEHLYVLGGSPAGSSDLTVMILGGGGGGGGNSPNNGPSFPGGGNGGIGGGNFYCYAAVFNNVGTIDLSGGNGQDAQSQNRQDNSGGGGGGAGGNGRFKAQSWFNTGTIQSLGGLGGFNGAADRVRTGSGSIGRIVIDYLTTFNGATNPVANAIQDNTLVTSISYQARLGISTNGTAFEYLTQNLKALALNAFDRIQVSWDSAHSTATFFENGNPIGTAVGALTAINGASTADFAIGANFVSAYANFLDGEVNDFRVWNSQRTQQQFAQYNLYNFQGVSANLVGSWFTTASANDNVSGGNNLSLQGTPNPLFVTDVPYAGATTRLDIDQTGGTAGFDYDLLTSLNEADKFTFVPAYDPQKSIQLNLNAKGTGDWTIVVHDGLNNVITTLTVKNANLPASGNYEFVWSSVWSPVIGATYHCHIYSTVNDGSVKCTADDTAAGIQFTTFYQFLLTDTDYHPTAQIINKLAIGNGHYLAMQDAAGGDGITNTWNTVGYNPMRLKFPAGWRVRCITTWRGYYAIGCWKGPTVKDFDQGIVFLWDGYSTTYNDFFYVPEGAINAMYGENGTLYIVAGYKGDLLEYTGGDSAVRVKRLPKVGKGNYIEVAPGGITFWQGLLRIAAAYKNNSTTFVNAVYTWGTLIPTKDPKSLSCDYPISDGNTGPTVSMGALIPVGGNLLIGWQDGTSYGVDNVNVNNPPQAHGTIEALIDDLGFYWKEKLLLTVRADHLALAAGANVDVKYKQNYEANWHNLGITKQNVGDTFTRLPLPPGPNIAYPNTLYRSLQVALDLYASQGVSPTVLEFGHDTDFQVTETDENAY